VTGRIIWEPPTPLQRVPLADAGGGGGGDWLLLEHEDDRVMPSCRALMAAGRYDLHHAVTYWGGYRAARAPPAPRRLASSAQPLPLLQCMVICGANSETCFLSFLSECIWGVSEAGPRRRPRRARAASSSN